MTLDEGLQAAAAGAARGVVEFPPDFHGFPGTVHGGAVAALFLRLTLPQPPVHARLELLRGVPTGTSLRLTTGSTGQQARLALFQEDRCLAEGALSREGRPPLDPDPVRTAWLTHGPPVTEVPTTTTCLACGTGNPLGLGLRFQVDDRWIWQEYAPRETCRARENSAHPALASVGLDELGWWLGALALAECGVTTELAITLVRSIPFAPLLFLGDRAAVRMDDDSRGRYCRAAGYLFAGTGDLLAIGSVRFAGSRAYTKRLVGPFLETTDLPTVARLFPSAVDLARGPRTRPGDGGS